MLAATLKMTKTITLILVLTLTLTSCQSQTEEEKLEKEVVEKLKEWAENPSFSNDILDPKTIEQFQDSGRVEYDLKEGLWIEYSLDTSIMGQTTTVVVGDKQLPMTFSGILKKEIGTYVKGQREGTWTMYESRDKKPPFYWNRKVLTSYKDGKKHGEENNYQGYGEKYQRPFMVRHWENGIEHGIGKIYDINHPYKLRQVYNAIDGQMWLLEKYSPNGKLQTKLIDTTLAGQELKYMQTYYESGQSKLTGYYINRKDMFGEWTNYYKNGQTASIVNYKTGKLNGKYQYFHDNGQLWTERTYNKGKLWNVHSNFDRKGKKKDKGTIRNGAGTLKVYDTEGNLIKTVEYKNGQENLK